jgi:glyoxylase-like metal-dependent hydrolase (beta-lactamase superfamily II)
MTDSATAQPRLIDLRHLGRERVIGAWLVGDVLVDPGPGSTLEAMLAGLGGQAPRVIALTHIHLDHAGATGALVERFPEVEVWVHERGAAHLVDPERLLTSAARLYGDDMDRLWGQTLPVPAERLRVLHGGERLDGFEVAYTPGHASHHVAYRHVASDHAFTGDAAGVRIGKGHVLAPTPPPDIDLEAWRESLQRVAAWRPGVICPTHFGAYGDVDDHLREIRIRLDEAGELAESLGEADFVAAIRARAADGVDAETAAAYEQAMPPEQCFAGLVRYLRRRERAA